LGKERSIALSQDGDSEGGEEDPSRDEADEDRRRESTGGGERLLRFHLLGGGASLGGFRVVGIGHISSIDGKFEIIAQGC
jgi:hypothetical protein